MLPPRALHTARLGMPQDDEHAPIQTARFGAEAHVTPREEEQVAGAESGIESEANQSRELKPSPYDEQRCQGTRQHWRNRRVV